MSWKREMMMTTIITMWKPRRRALSSQLHTVVYKTTTRRRMPIRKSPMRRPKFPIANQQRHHGMDDDGADHEANATPPPLVQVLWRVVMVMPGPLLSHPTC
jgi:hypothetical protein